MVILEDDTFLAQMYELVLLKHSSHHQILKFTDGDEAWRELSKADPDLFITDVQHPGTDAWEMLRLLAAEKVTYPILMISGEFQPEATCKTFYPGLHVTMMSKPFDVPTLLKCLTVLLDPADGSGVSDGGSGTKPRPAERRP